MGDGRLFAWLLYGGFSLAATAVMLALLLGAARQGNRRARLVTLTMVWLLPTHLLLAVSAVVALLGWEWVHPWWPLADWAALMFMAGLLRLAVDDWLVAAGPGDDRAPARRLAKHPWAIYVPPAVLLPLYLTWSLAPQSAVGRLWFGRAGHDGALLVGLSAIYILLALRLWRDAALQRPGARIWRRALLVVVAIHLATEVLVPLLPDRILPGWLIQTAAALPHAIVVLGCAAGSAADGLIRPGLAEGMVRWLTVVTAAAVGVVGGGAVAPFVPAPWDATLAALSGVVLFGATVQVLRAWLVSAGTGEDVPAPAAPDAHPGLFLDRAAAAAGAGAGAASAPTGTARLLLDDLTPRQRDVVLAVLEGLSNAEIADRLCIAEVTVKKHLTAVFQKLGVSTRAQLIAFCSRDAALWTYLAGSPAGSPPGSPAGSPPPLHPGDPAGGRRPAGTGHPTPPVHDHLGRPVIFD